MPRRPAARTVGAHGVRRSSFRTEVLLAVAGGAALVAAIACWAVAESRDSEQLGNRGSGLFLLGLTLGGFALVARMRSDSSVWRLPVGPWTRRIVLTVLAGGLALLALGGVFALATGEA